MESRIVIPHTLERLTSRAGLTGPRDPPIAGKTLSPLDPFPRRTLTRSDSGAGSGSRARNFKGEFSELVRSFWNWRIQLILKNSISSNETSTQSPWRDLFRETHETARETPDQPLREAKGGAALYPILCNTLGKLGNITMLVSCFWTNW